MKNLFLKVKPSYILMLLKDSQQLWYPSKLARASGTSYVHTVNLLVALRKMGAVSIEKKGRQNIYKLTEKGTHLASSLEDFAKKCDAMESEHKASLSKAEQERQAASPPAQPAASAAQKQEKVPEQEKK